MIFFDEFERSSCHVSKSNLVWEFYFKILIFAIPDILGFCSAEFGLRRGAYARLARDILGPAISRIFPGLVLFFMFIVRVEAYISVMG